MLLSAWSLGVWEDITNTKSVSRGLAEGVESEI